MAKAHADAIRSDIRTCRASTRNDPGSRSEQGVTKTFPGVTALSEVSLELVPGKVTALVGENGAGKSTVVKILTGIYQPDGGRLKSMAPERFPTAQDAGDCWRYGDPSGDGAV